MKIKLFADGANLTEIQRLADSSYVCGFTTNPSLMRKAGVTDYEQFAKEMLALVGNRRPVSFEVISDEFPEMERQARKIVAWGPNVYVKIPVMNTRGESSYPLVQTLHRDNLRLNITGLMTFSQVAFMLDALTLSGSTPAILSIFAGRIADTGCDPVHFMEKSVHIASAHSEIEILWASTREVFNIVQAEAAGCHIITVTGDILAKLPLLGKNLFDYSLETVRQFYDDARGAGYELT